MADSPNSVHELNNCSRVQYLVLVDLTFTLKTCFPLLIKQLFVCAFVDDTTLNVCDSSLETVLREFTLSFLFSSHLLGTTLHEA